MKLSSGQADRVSTWAMLSHAFPIHTDILQLQRYKITKGWKAREPVPWSSWNCCWSQSMNHGTSWTQEAW